MHRSTRIVLAALALWLSWITSTVAQQSAPTSQPSAMRSDSTSLGERVARIEGELASYTDHFEEIITASIRSSDRYRDYVTLGVTVALGLFTVLGSVAFLWYRKAREHGQRIADELYVATQIAKAVPDLWRADQAQDEAVRRVWASNAYAQILRAEERGQKDADWLNWKAYALRRLGEHGRALEAAREAKELAPIQSPQRGRAMYNIACYSALLGKKEEVLQALREALLEDSRYRTVATGDSDFDSIRQDNILVRQFKEIVDS